jgi:hypothetical protein
MWKHVPWLMAIVGLVDAAPASAQEPRVEVSVLGGWTLSEGVNSDPVVTGDGNVYDRIDPKDSFSWGLSGGYFVNNHAEVGFLFRQQLSTLEARGTNTVDVGDMTLNNYHVYFGYDFLSPEARVHPYVMGGVGATNFSSVDYTRRNGQSGTIAASPGSRRRGVPESSLSARE